MLRTEQPSATEPRVEEKLSDDEMRDLEEASMEVIKPEGRVNLYGIAPESEPYLPEEAGDPRVFRGRVAEADVHEQLFAWVAQGVVNPEDWISHRMPWTEYQRGFDMVASKKANKVVLTF